MRFVITIAALCLPALTAHAKPSSVPNLSPSDAVILHLQETKATLESQKALLKSKTIAPVDLKVIKAKTETVKQSVQRLNKKTLQRHTNGPKGATLIRVGHGQPMKR